MDRTDYPDKYNFFELGYCGHPKYPHTKIFLDQASNLIILHFKEEDHFFIKDTLRNNKIKWVLLYLSASFMKKWSSSLKCDSIKSLAWLRKRVV